MLLTYHKLVTKRVGVGQRKKNKMDILQKEVFKTHTIFFTYYSIFLILPNNFSNIFGSRVY